jgi:hypothetical protein
MKWTVMGSGIRRDPLSGYGASYIREIRIEPVRMDIFRIFSRLLEKVVSIMGCRLGHLGILGLVVILRFAMFLLVVL